MIYIIFGASGSGKTTLMNSVFLEFGEKSINKKGTTRNIRTYDDIEIESYPQGLPKEKFGGDKAYIYSQYGYEYGIEKKQLDDAILGNYPHFVICNDIETIKQLRNDYKNKIVVIYLKFDVPAETLLSIQKSRGITDDEINLRVSKIEYFNELFIHNSSFFDAVISNRFGDNPEIQLLKQLKSIMSAYEEEKRRVPPKEVIFEIIDYLQDSIKRVEIEKSKCSEIEKDFIFIVMPFENECNSNDINEKIWSTYAAINTAALRTGYRAERVDRPSYTNQTDNNIIDNRIYEYIKKAEIVIVDLSYERQNCYFEVGYALALNKDIILTAQEGTKIHFNLEHYGIITYQRGSELSQKLTQLLYERRSRN